MGVGRRRWRSAAACVVVLVLGAACGARVSDEQRLAAVGNGGSGSLSGSGAGSNDAGGGTDLVTGAGDDSAGGTATTVAGQSGPTTTAFSGDNGGATDVGVTGDTITVGNVATLSGPVPGLFQGAVIGTQAWV